MPQKRGRVDVGTWGREIGVPRGMHAWKNKGFIFIEERCPVSLQARPHVPTSPELSPVDSFHHFNDVSMRETMERLLLITREAVCSYAEEMYEEWPVLSAHAQA